MWAGIWKGIAIFGLFVAGNFVGYIIENWDNLELPNKILLPLVGLTFISLGMYIFMDERK